jgi:hypothetical protein
MFLMALGSDCSLERNDSDPKQFKICMIRIKVAKFEGLAESLARKERNQEVLQEC